MLTDQTIKEGTVLMLSILNIPVMPNGNYQLPNTFPYDIANGGWIELPLSEMRFETDWNWLHAVIDEIHKSYAEIEIGNMVVRIRDNGYNEAFYPLNYSPIQACFYSLNQYLKWCEEKEVPQPKTDIYVDDNLPF